MADILPTVTTFSEVLENTNFQAQFTAELGEFEELVSLRITEFEPNVTINVDTENATITGQYKDSFILNEGGLKYIYLDNFVKGTSRKFEELPDPSQRPVSLYEFIPPNPTERNYQYTVTLDYLDNSELETDPTADPIEGQVVKVYTVPVRGDYSSWAQQLVDYIGESE